MDDPAIQARLAAVSGFPVVVSEARMTTIGEDDHALTATLDRLVDRIVKPKRRQGRGPINILQELERRLEPLIERHVVVANHVFERTRTGVPRRVDFFANSGANVAVDTLRLNLKRADEIRLRADAQAYKISDITEKQRGLTYMVLATFGEDEDLIDANAQARKILVSTPARIVDDMDEVAIELERAATRGRVPAAS
jgi:hypothetical protein